MTLDKAYEFCFNAVRARDKEHFVAALFAPADRRPHLYALYAFYQEVARIGDLVSDPLPGEIRLQWWHDALSGTSHGDVESNPLAAAVMDTIRACDLPVQMLLDMIEARSFDLYDDPMPSLEELESYARETEATLIRLAVRVLSGKCGPDVSAIAGHAGIASTLTDLMRTVPYHAARRQLFLPVDVLERHCVDDQKLFCGQSGPALASALADLRERARCHLDHMRLGLTRLSEDCVPAFLTTGLIERYLTLMERPGYDPMTTPVVIPLWRRYWILYRTAERARKHFARAA